MHIMEENGSSALGLIQLPGAHSVRPPSMSPAPANSVNPMQAPVQGGNSAVEHEPRSGRGGRIMYIECKAGQLTGPGRIGRVTFFKTGRTLYYRGKRFQSLKGAGFKSNYYDVDTGKDYWISGPKRKGGDALYMTNTRVEIDDDVREEYWLEIRRIPELVEDRWVHG